MADDLSRLHREFKEGCRELGGELDEDRDELQCSVESSILRLDKAARRARVRTDVVSRGHGISAAIPRPDEVNTEDNGISTSLFVRGTNGGTVRLAKRNTESRT